MSEYLSHMPYLAVLAYIYIYIYIYIYESGQLIGLKLSHVTPEFQKIDYFILPQFLLFILKDPKVCFKRKEKILS